MKKGKTLQAVPYSNADSCYITLKDEDSGKIYTGEFVPIRVQLDTVPDGKYAYRCRYAVNGNWWVPRTIENNEVNINFAGTFITEDKISFNTDDYTVFVFLVG